MREAGPPRRSEPDLLGRPHGALGVDNPDLLRLYGGRPQIVSSLAWAIGTSLGALAGILLTPIVGLQYYDLTLLVI